MLLTQVSRRRLLGGVFGVMSLVIAGCGAGGPKVVRVTGKVTSNGKPLPDVRIRFIPEGSQGATAFADADADGSFRVTTFKPGDGMVPGQYKADVNIPAPIAPPDAGAKIGDISFKAMPPGSAVPEKYRDAKTSELSYTIKGPMSLEINLK